MKNADFHDIHAPGMPGGTIRYHIQRGGAGGWYYIRDDAPDGQPSTGPFARYDDVIGAIKAIEAAGVGESPAVAGINF